MPEAWKWHTSWLVTCHWLKLNHLALSLQGSLENTAQEEEPSRLPSQSLTELPMLLILKYYFLLDKPSTICLEIAFM